MDDFAFKAGGVDFQVKKAKFSGDKISVQTASLKLPDSLGGAQAAVYNLEIGKDGLKIGGGQFRLPDFTIGTVGVKNVLAEFYLTPEGIYSISAGATMGFEKFSLKAEFTLEYVPQPPSLQLKRVTLAFKGSVLAGTAIPIGTTGIFITGAEGRFDLTSGALEIGFKVEAVAGGEFAGLSLIKVRGEVGLKTRPFELYTGAKTFLFNPPNADGYQVSSVEFWINRNGVTLKGAMNFVIIHFTLELAFGRDVAGEFTLYGRLQADLMIRRGEFGCPLGLCLPDKNIEIARARMEAGKFQHRGENRWGARGEISWLALWTNTIFVTLSPQFQYEEGDSARRYTPVRPAPASVAAADEAGLMSLSSAAAQDTYEIDITSPADALLIVEKVDPANAAAPAGIELLDPQGRAVQVTHAYSYEGGAGHLYTLRVPDPAQSVGVWTLNLKPGNVAEVLGSDPAPVASEFRVTTAGGTVLADAQPGQQPRVTIQNGEQLSFAWAVSDDQQVSYELYVENSAGTRTFIQREEGQAAFQGSTTWRAALPAGVYTVSLKLDDGVNAPVVVAKEPITIADTTPPAAPRGLTATPNPDGSVVLTWDGAAAEADVDGYTVSVDGRAPTFEGGRLSTVTVYGLMPGSAARISVAAYDLSGNVGPAATVGATLPAFALTSTSPAAGAVEPLVGVVEAAFSQPLTGANLSVAGPAGNVAGVTSAIAGLDEAGNPATVGLRLVADAPLPDGDYTAVVSGRNAAGTIITLSWSFQVATPPPAPTAPETTITGAPSGTVAETSATVSFGGTGGAAPVSFECSLNGQPFAPCVSPVTYSDLADGPQTVRVRAIGADGVADSTPAEATWAVQAPAPETTITGAPSGTVAETSATVAFGGTGGRGALSFECALNGAAFAACVSPLQLNDLADGAYTLQVRAVDSRGVADSTPAEATWAVQAPAPETTITSAPSGTVAESSATVAFSGTGGRGALSFECALNGAAFSACVSPLQLSNLADGVYTLQVRAVDSRGVADATPAEARWMVVAPAPETTITGAPSGTVTATSATVAFGGTGGRGALSFECALNGAAFAACVSPLQLSDLADGAYTLQVRAVDSRGVADATPAEAGWTVQGPAPETTITSAPSGTVTATSATVAFGGAGGRGALSFECALNGAAFSACVSPLQLSNLADGAYTLQVRAVDSRGVADSSPAEARWTVQAPVATGLYRARQVGSRVHIERHIAQAGLGDFDGDPIDGWALVGRTNGAADDGELRGFFVQDGVPYAIIFNRNNNLGNRCILVTPRSLTRVARGETRLMTTVQDPAPCTPPSAVATAPEAPLCYVPGAQQVSAFRVGLTKSGAAVPPDRSNPALALGLPQRTDSVNFVSLGFGGSVTLRFTNPIVNDGTSAADFRVWETSFGDATRAWSRYPEAARIEVSADGVTWTEVGRTTDKDQAYDLVIPQAQFVRVTDISDPRFFGSTDDGFDLDAIEVLGGCARP